MKLKSLLLTTLVAGATLFSCSLNDSDVDPSTDSNSDLNTASSLSTSPYTIDLVKAGIKNLDGTYTWTWKVTKNEGAQGISHFSFSDFGSCVSYDDIVDMASGTDISALVYGPKVAWEADPSVKNEGDACLAGQSVMKFDAGSDAPMYYSFTVNGAYGTGTNQAVYKSGSRTGCGIVEFTGIGCPETDEEGCSMSQGFYFASKNSASVWEANGGSVTVGTITLTEDAARELFKVTKRTNGMRAFFQAAAIKLSGSSVTSPTVLGYVATIDASLTNLSSTDKNLGNLAGAIGNWIDSNHCEK
jgi:hypothetical protein